MARRCFYGSVTLSEGMNSDWICHTEEEYALLAVSKTCSRQLSEFLPTDLGLRFVNTPNSSKFVA